MTQNEQSQFSRRQFVKTAAAAAAATSAFPYIVGAAETNKPMRIGVIGFGGRGRGAVYNGFHANPNLRLVAFADLYADKAAESLEKVKEVAEVEEKHQFVGVDGYKKLLELDLDYVILATPPYYRPEHFEACVEAGKNVFMEKPVAVDPVGARRIMAAGEKAKAKGLSVVAGTQRRHDALYNAVIKRIHDGEIGDVVSGSCYWNSSQLWYKPRQEGWSEDEWMHRDWVNWAWLSGDHIVEQHVHNIDVMNWVLGTHPEKVVSMGGRARRVTGNQFDHFASEFFYPGEVRVLSQCRQVNGCVNNVSEFVRGTKGYSYPRDFLSTTGKLKIEKISPYVQEHKDLIAAIQSGKPINEAQNVAESTLSGIMARTSAYTGKEVTWDEMMKSDLELKRPTYKLTPENIKADIPVPGTVDRKR